jgi:DNA-binding IclR family transcriptional regulator
MKKRNQAPPTSRPAASMSGSDKLLAALGLFNGERSSWSVEAAAKQLGLGTSTTYRYFKSLADVGLIVAIAAGRYVLGPAITQLDRQTRLLDPLITVAKPIMQHLLKQLSADGVLLLCRLYKNQVMCVHQEARGSQTIAVSYERGKLMPLHRGAASKIVLAYLPARSVRRFHEENATDMAAVSLGKSWTDVKSSLFKIRAAGVVVAGAEIDPGVVGVGVPLFHPDGTIIGSLGLVIPEANSSGEMLDRAIRLMKSTANIIDTDFATAVA